MGISREQISEPTVYHLKILDWPEGERPREKLLERGVDMLTEAELLAILIRTGAGKITAVDLARKLIQRYGSLNAIASRPLREYMEEKGIGEAKAVSIAAAFEIGRRWASKRHAEELQIRSPEDIFNRFHPLLRDLKQEVFYVLLLDSANHFIRHVEICKGILNASPAHPREVFRAAIVEPAASVILMHNHPSGNPEPSAEDIQITRQIVDAGKVVGIPVHDHIIIAGVRYTSFAERGLIN